MDEPTSSLTLTETDRLLKVIADLSASGVSVIFISHRLAEVTACADRVVVLRDGRLVGRLAQAEISPAAMIRLMIGRDLKSIYRPPAAPPGEALLEIDGRPDRDLPPERAVDLTVRQRRDPRARRADRRRAHRAGAGRLRHRPARTAARCGSTGASWRSRSPRDAIDAGHLPRARGPQGQRRHPRPADHATTSRCRSCRTWRASGWCAPGRDSARRDRAAPPRHPRAERRAPQVGTLSGGNQQKVVLAKWLAMAPQAIIFDEPTRGIDVGAKREIYDMMRALADAGVAILMISSDMEEVIGVSDRIAVMHEGRDQRHAGARRNSPSTGARAGRRPAGVSGERNAEEGLRAARPDPRGRDGGRASSTRASCRRSTSPTPRTSSGSSGSSPSARASSSSPAASSCRSAR